MISLPTIPYQDFDFIPIDRLTPAEKDLVLLWRSMNTTGTVLEYNVENGKPVIADVKRDNRIYWVEPIDYPLTPFEVEIIRLNYEIDFGRVYLIIQNCDPIEIIRDTYKRILLGSKKKA